MIARFTCPKRTALAAAGLALLLNGCEKQPTPPEKPKEPEKVATYAPVEWNALPKTSDAELLAGFQAWYSACPRLSRDAIWRPACEDAKPLADGHTDSRTVQDFLRRQFKPYGLQAGNGERQGLITGYYEPVYPGSLSQTPQAGVPVYGTPDDLIVVDLDELYPELKGKRLRGRLEGRVLKPYDDAGAIRENGIQAPVIAWLTNSMDLQFLQIQGSGRIRLPDGRQMRIGYADQNGHPYRPIGRWLVENGLVPKEEVSMRRIREWAEANPQRLSELLDSNPSYVFFSQRPDSNEGPRGSLNVPLTAGYSVAVDRRVVPLGSLLWLSTTRPDDQAPLIRPVAAQDTGGAITGEVRADFFWGTGDVAGELAGHMKQSGQLWLLWPKDAPLPETP